MTVLDLIKSSLRLIGVIASGETPDGSMTSDALQALNLLLNSWQNEGLISLTEEQAFTATSGNMSYVIGSSQTWNGNKPLSIITAKIRDSAGNDYPLKQISYNDFLRIFSKSDSGRPYTFAYVPAESTGTIYLHFTPDTTYTVTLLSQKALTEYTVALLSSIIDLPAGYLAALKYNLAVELSPEYSTTISQLIIAKADDYLVKLKRTNLKKPSRISYDPIFSKKQNYDVITDTIY